MGDAGFAQRGNAGIAMTDDSIAPMSADDLDWVCAQEAALQAHPWTRGNFMDALEAGNEAWIMRVKDKPVAYAVVLRVLDEAHLLGIGVALSAQRRGYGRRLLQHLCERAAEEGATCFFLEVRVSNDAARALYRAMGFDEVGRRRGYYPAGVGREDAIVMRRTL